MARCFLVLGPERSGTRMLTASLLSVGIAGGSDHVQEFDDYDLSLIDQDFVIRRSFPHGHIQCPDLMEITTTVAEAGHELIVLAIFRQIPYVLRSRDRVHWDNGDFHNPQLASANIFEQLLKAGSLLAVREIAPGLLGGVG